jgi:hypothetical protein
MLAWRALPRPEPLLVPAPLGELISAPKHTVRSTRPLSMMVLPFLAVPSVQPLRESSSQPTAPCRQAVPKVELRTERSAPRLKLLTMTLFSVNTEPPPSCAASTLATPSSTPTALFVLQCEPQAGNFQNGVSTFPSVGWRPQLVSPPQEQQSKPSFLLSTCSQSAQ